MTEIIQKNIEYIYWIFWKRITGNQESYAEFKWRELKIYLEYVKKPILWIESPPAHTKWDVSLYSTPSYPDDYEND